MMWNTPVFTSVLPRFLTFKTYYSLFFLGFKMAFWVTRWVTRWVTSLFLC